MEILTSENIKELKTLGDEKDQVEWRIGEIALEAWNRNIENGGHYHRFQIFTAVAREVRCSKGRVEKLFTMAQFYSESIREKHPDFKLGHFEVAMNFGPEEAPAVLEYANVYAEDKHELPKVKDLDFLYRREVLGQPSTKDLVPPKRSRTEAVLQTQLINLMRLIRGQLINKPLSETSREKLNRGLKLIEEVLPELIDEPEVISYS